MIENNNDNLIEFVRKFLVDFVNAESEEEKYNHFREITESGLSCLTKGRLSISGAFESLPNEYDYEDYRYDFDEINRIHSIILKMLRIALIDDEFKKLYPEANKKTIEETDLEEYIRDLFVNGEHTETFRWRGKGKTYILPERVEKDYIYDELEYIIIKTLFDLFESDDLADAIGYQYFSFCPKCGKFFYKKRKDQVYCSESCRSTDGTRRFRKKQT